MSKKILAMFMAVAMAFSLLPVTVFAEGETPVAQVGETPYTSLDAAIEAAGDGATVKVLVDCTTNGFNLRKNIILEGNSEEKPTITFSEKGIALWGKTLAFKNCNVVMTGIGATPYTAEWGWMTICASKDASLRLNNTSITMDGTGTASGVHAIYFCSNNKLTLENGSELTIKNYPQDALEWDGGDGGYNVNITNSTFISDHNRSGFTGTFYATIDNSTVNVINSTGNGSNGSHFNIKNDSKVKFNNNKAHGLSAGILKVSNSKVTANNNGGNGIHVGESLTISEESVVEIQNNECSISSTWTIPGALYVAKGKESTIDATSKVTISKNNGSGILLKSGNLSISEGADIAITENTAEKLGYGGGVNVRGNLILPSGAVLYNNHAENAGDDIYSTGTITFGKVGTDWTLDDCDHLINGWYDDQELSRWAAHSYPSYICQFDEFDKTSGIATLDYEVALKAAHDVIHEDPIEPDNDRSHSKSKEATNLVKQNDGTYTSDVTLTLPSVEESPVYDVVFVLDKSTSAELKQEAVSMLEQLKGQIEGTETTINVGVVVFNREAHVTAELTNLTTGYEKIEEAINYTVSSGTNTHAGLLAGKAMLDADQTVTDNHKYMILVSDGITYMYNQTPTVTAWTWNTDAKTRLAWVGPDNWGTKHAINGQANNGYIPDSWQKYLEEVAVQIERQGTTYEHPYISGKDYLEKGESVTPCGDYPATDYQNYANTIDKALYLTNEVYQQAKEKGYHCYAMKATLGEQGRAYTWGPSFIEYLAGGQEASFEDIHNDIYYLLSEGSTVEDVIGYGTDNYGNAYNFDFVNDITKLTLKEGNETLTAVDLSLDLAYGDVNETARYGFRSHSAEPQAREEYVPEYQYDYVLHYYEKGTDGKSDECFLWEINVPVSKFAPVSLTYQVKLTNPQTTANTYGEYDKNGSQKKSGLYTNLSATLYPVDSDGVRGTPENFLKPTVSYTVKGGGGSGGSSRPTLNTKDHYGYIIGYPVDYYTGEPTTDQTKKPVRPEGKITRAEVATIYFRMLTDESRTKFWSQSNGYSDVKAGDWFNNAVSTLSNAGIIAGYEDGTFRPNGYITRAEFATIAARFFDATYSGKDLFPDIDGHWAKDYINKAADKGFVNGYEDGTFRPDRNITRAEAVTLVNRTLERHPDKNYFTKDMLVWPDNMDTTKWYYADMQEATNSHKYQMLTKSDKTQYEKWTQTLPIRNWEALEKAWSNANSSQGTGNVV